MKIIDKSFETFLELKKAQADAFSAVKEERQRCAQTGQWEFSWNDSREAIPTTNEEQAPYWVPISSKYVELLDHLDAVRQENDDKAQQLVEQIVKEIPSLSWVVQKDARPYSNLSEILSEIQNEEE